MHKLNDDERCTGQVFRPAHRPSRWLCNGCRATFTGRHQPYHLSDTLQKRDGEGKFYCKPCARAKDPTDD
jgi:hypothetical protein